MNVNVIKHAFLIVFIFVFCFSCADKKVDNSLTIDAYKALGMPDPTKKWDMADYTQAQQRAGKNEVGKATSAAC